MSRTRKISPPRGAEHHRQDRAHVGVGGDGRRLDLIEPRRTTTFTIDPLDRSQAAASGVSEISTGTVTLVSVSGPAEKVSKAVARETPARCARCGSDARTMSQPAGTSTGPDG